jgi:hypothetical protein
MIGGFYTGGKSGMRLVSRAKTQDTGYWLQASSCKLQAKSNMADANPRGRGLPHGGLGLELEACSLELVF